MAVVNDKATYQLDPKNVAGLPAPVFGIAWSVEGDAYVIDTVGEDNGYTVVVKAVGPGSATLKVSATSLAGVVLTDSALLEAVDTPVDEEAVALNLRRVG